MLQVSSRLLDLMHQLESGSDPTPEQLRRIAQLQALDIAAAGEAFVKRAVLEEEKRTEEFRISMEV